MFQTTNQTKSLKSQNSKEQQPQQTQHFFAIKNRKLKSFIQILHVSEIFRSETQPQAEPASVELDLLELWPAGC